MAPIKPDVQQSRIAAARTVRSILDGFRYPRLYGLDDVSTVKGLFTRTFKRDQWDWFTVWSQLGYPTHRTAREISSGLKGLRTSVQRGDDAKVDGLIKMLVARDVPGTLERFISGTAVQKPGHGFIYILSTREMKDILKIGYTERDVATRVNEINSTTGVLVPYGSRAAWIVPHARRVESEVHARLAEFRVRKDREFFQVDFLKALRTINAYVDELDIGDGS